MAKDVMLILPGYSELVLKEAQSIAEKKRRDNAIAETAKQKSEFHDKIQSRRKRDRDAIRRDIAAAVIRECRHIGIEDMLDEFSSDNIVNIQKIVIQKLCQKSSNSCLYIAAGEMMNAIKTLLKNPWYVFLVMPISMVLMMASLMFMMPISLIRQCIDFFVSTPPWSFSIDDNFMLMLSFIVVLVCLTIAGYIHVRILKRIRQKIGRFLKIYPNSLYYLSPDKLKKEIRNIKN